MNVRSRDIKPDIVPAPRAPSPQSVLNRLEWLSRIMDSAIEIPGTSFRIGLDGIIGLIPGFGDSIGALVGLYIVLKAYELGVPKVTVVRMVMNVLIDAVIGTLPVVGDALDFAYRSNIMNVELLRKHLDHPKEAARASMAFVAVIVCLVLAVCCGLVIAGVFLVERIF